MDAKCSVCGRHFEVDSVSADLSGCTCPFCGGALAGTTVRTARGRDMAANAMWILFSTTSFIIAALAVCSCLLWVKVHDLTKTVNSLAANSADTAETNSLAETVNTLQREIELMNDSLAAKFPQESGETLRHQLAATAADVAAVQNWQKKYSPALEILGNLQGTDNLLDSSFAEVYNTIDNLAAREAQRYTVLCDQLNNYALSVSGTLGALETDMDTIFAFSGDTAGVINTLSENINGMETDISRLINRVNDIDNSRRIIFLGRPAPPRIPGKPHHAPRPSRPGSSMVHQKR